MTVIQAAYRFTAGGTGYLSDGSGGIGIGEGEDGTEGGGGETGELFIQRDFFVLESPTFDGDPLLEVATRRIDGISDAVVLHEREVMLDPGLKVVLSGLHTMHPMDRFMELVRQATGFLHDAERREDQPDIPVAHLSRTRELDPFSVRLYYLFLENSNRIITSFRNLLKGSDEQYERTRRTIWIRDIEYYKSLIERNILTGNALNFVTGMIIKLEAEAMSQGWRPFGDELFNKIWSNLRRQGRQR